MMLFEAVRGAMRRLHRSPRTEEAYLHWIREFIRFHDGKHPRQMTAEDITAFLNDLAVWRRTAASTQNQALGDKDVRTTMIYTHVVNRGPLGVVSPLDR